MRGNLTCVPVWITDVFMGLLALIERVIEGDVGVVNGGRNFGTYRRDVCLVQN